MRDRERVVRKEMEKEETGFELPERERERERNRVLRR